MRILAVYNICGIKKDNTPKYPYFLRRLTEQQFDGELDITVSACMPRPQTIPVLRAQFPHCNYNVITDKFPVNVTFNHSILKTVEHKGKYDAYIYFSGDSYLPTTDFLQGMVDVLKEDEDYGMVTARANIDGVYAYGLQLDDCRHHPESDKRALQIMFGDGTDYIVPVGRACAPHVNVISHKVIDYYGRAYPDIFAGYCTESVFSFILAAIKLKWVVARNFIVEHHYSLDGPSCGFKPEERDGEPYDHPLVGDSLLHIFDNPRARSLGLGYEECQHIVDHDPSQFDKNGFCINDELAPYIRDNVYLSKNQLDYEGINSNWL